MLIRHASAHGLIHMARKRAITTSIGDLSDSADCLSRLHCLR